MGKEARGLLRVVTKCLAEHREFTTKVLTKVLGFSRVDGDAHVITRESTSDLRRSPRVPQAAPCYLITGFGAVYEALGVASRSAYVIRGDVDCFMVSS